jgi:hypothetical protein
MPTHGPRPSWLLAVRSLLKQVEQCSRLLQSPLRIAVGHGFFAHVRAVALRAICAEPNVGIVYR